MSEIRYKSIDEAVRGYFKHQLEEGEDIRGFTNGMSPGSLLLNLLFSSEIVIKGAYLLTKPIDLIFERNTITPKLNNLYADALMSDLICLTTRRLIITRGRFAGGGFYGYLVNPADEKDESTYIPLPNIVRADYMSGFLVGRLDIQLIDKSELSYQFITRKTGSMAQEIATIISSELMNN